MKMKNKITEQMNECSQCSPRNTCIALWVNACLANTSEYLTILVQQYQTYNNLNISIRVQTTYVKASLKLSDRFIKLV